jgi:hypothetical protein
MTLKEMARIKIRLVIKTTLKNKEVCLRMKRMDYLKSFFKNTRTVRGEGNEQFIPVCSPKINLSSSAQSRGLPFARA